MNIYLTCVCMMLLCWTSSDEYEGLYVYIYLYLLSHYTWFIYSYIRVNRVPLFLFFFSLFLSAPYPLSQPSLSFLLLISLFLSLLLHWTSILNACASVWPSILEQLANVGHTLLQNYVHTYVRARMHTRTHLVVLRRISRYIHPHAFTTRFTTIRRPICR